MSVVLEEKSINFELMIYFDLMLLLLLMLFFVTLS